MLNWKVEDITPAIAKEYLKFNTDNYRKMTHMSRRVIKRYADDMVNGRWELNGVPICFGKNGVLKDGQHRLAAIIMANVTVKMAVVRGVDDHVTIYDIGKKRTNMDIANAQNIDCDSTVVAVANIIVNKFTGHKGGVEVVNYVRDHIDELNRAERITCYGTGAKSKNAPSIAATYILLRTKTMPPYEIELFFRLMNDFAFTHADGYEVSPALIAQRMFDERGSKRSGTQIQKERMEILFMAMEDFHKGHKREMKYKIQEPFKFIPYLNKVRKEDGLEG